MGESQDGVWVVSGLTITRRYYCAGGRRIGA
jgi:hypothetical protein